MVEMPHHSFYSLIGKPVIEKYGRFKGRVIAFELDEDGSLKNIVFENGGVILYKSVSSFEIYNDHLIFLPSIVKEGKFYIKEFKDLSLYLDTLKKIFGIERSKAFVDQYYRRINSKYRKLMDGLDKYISKLNSRKNKIEREINRLKKLIFNLHMGRENGFIDQRVYQLVYDLISNEILKYTSELEDIEHLEVDISTLSSKVENLIKELEEVLMSEEEEIKYS